MHHCLTTPTFFRGQFASHSSFCQSVLPQRVACLASKENKHSVSFQGHNHALAEAIAAFGLIASLLVLPQILPRLMDALLRCIGLTYQ